MSIQSITNNLAIVLMFSLAANGMGCLGPRVSDADTPTAQITSRDAELDTIYLGESILLDGTESFDPQGYPLSSWDWSCTDGTVGSGPIFQLVAEIEGLLTCQLVVTSRSGHYGEASVSMDVVRRAGTADWTLMVFVNGDNDLEGAALDDLNEMEQVGSSGQVNVVVQMDRSAGYTTDDGNWSGARRYLVDADSDSSKISSPALADLGSVDSGDPATVVDFVDWSVQAYPAVRYGLVLWNHGGGWRSSTAPDPLKAISYDYDTGNSLSVADGELEQMLDEITDTLGKRLHLLGMDACLMQTWEAAHVAAPYAEVYVASQEVEGWDGWSYDTFLADLVSDPTMGPGELGAAVAQRFSESGDATQSVIDLAELEVLDTALDDLADTILESSDTDVVLDLYYAASGSWSSSWLSDSRDLGGLLDELASRTDDTAVETAAAGARVALDEVVLANHTTGSMYENLGGLSIHAPTSGPIDDVYLESTWAEDGRWDDLLQAFLSL